MSRLAATLGIGRIPKDDALCHAPVMAMVLVFALFSSKGSLAFLFCILILYITLSSYKDRELEPREAYPAPGKCPACGEELDDAAKPCPMCGEETG